MNTTHRTADEPTAGSAKPVLEIRDLKKRFGAVTALDGVSFRLERGEVLGLLGDNGAGKSTLVKCLSGVHAPSGGSILIDGREVEISSPDHARHIGIETVQQTLAIIPELDVATNMFLNRERTARSPLLRAIGWVDRRTMYRESRQILDRLHVRVPSVRMKMAQLSGGQRQAVAVGRAVQWSKDIVLLDEPTAALGVEQSATILALIRRLAEEGTAVLLVSHNMQDVVDVCDRAVVLRHGRKVGDVAIQDVTAPRLVDLITGADRGDEVNA